MAAKQIVLEIGDKPFTFNVSNAEYNKFVDQLSGGKSVNASFNFLTRTVDGEQRKGLKALLTDDETHPISMLVMDVVKEISDEFGEGLPEVVKLQPNTGTSLSETD